MIDRNITTDGEVVVNGIYVNAVSCGGGVDVTGKVIKTECDGFILIIKQSPFQRKRVPADSLRQCALATGSPSRASEITGARQTGWIDIKSPCDRKRTTRIQRKIIMRIQQPEIGIVKIIAHRVAVLGKHDLVIINTNGIKFNAHGHDSGGHEDIGRQNEVQSWLGDILSLIQFKVSTNGDGAIGFLRAVIGCHHKCLTGWQQMQ